MKQRVKCEFRVITLERKLWTAIVMVTLLAGTGVAAFAQSSNAPARLSYDAFRTISDRNIFNPSRYARSSSRTARTDSKPSAHVESFTLVGLMAYEKGVFAFFDGTKANYKQVLKTDGAISDFKVAAVTSDQVRLLAGTNEFLMRVGMQVRREDEGDWFLTDSSESTSRRRVVISRGRSGAAVSGGDIPPGESGEMTANGEPEVIVIEGSPTEESTESNGNGAPANGEPARTDAGASDITDPVLLRLMQRRQELNQ